jgi:hypothetical protein
MANIYRSRIALVSPIRRPLQNLDPAPLAPELSLHHFGDEPGELVIAHVTAGGAQPGCDIVSYHLAPAAVLLPDGVKQVDGSWRWRDVVIQLSGRVLYRTLGEGIAGYFVRH